MFILIKDLEIDIEFKHFLKGPAYPTIETLCYLRTFHPEEGKKLRIGNAWCAEGDAFRKATGRKIALKRAISIFSREDRRIIWTEYFKTHKK